MQTDLTRGQIAEIDAGIRPIAAMRTVTFDSGIESGKLPTKAALTTTLTGTNNDMVFTAKTTGLAGNDISIEYKDDAYTPGHSAATVHVDDNHIIVDLKTSAGVAASTVLTSNNTNVTDGKVVVVNATTYRFKNTLAQVGDVKIGASADATLLSLAKTINGTGAAGTDMFAGTPAHTTVSSSAAVSSHTITLTARSVGVAGNSYPSTTDETTLSYTSTVFAGGEDVNQVLSTAAEVKVAFDGNAEAAALVDSVANSGADDGSGVVTVLAETSLTGGSDGIVKLFTVNGCCKVTLVGYCETSLTGNTATLVHGKTGTTNDLITILTCTDIDAGTSIDGTTGVVARGTAPAIIPLKSYFDGQTIFATVATASVTAGKINYLAYYTPLSEGAHVSVTE